MKYITDYDHLCGSCRDVISHLESIMSEVPDRYTSDPEGPLMLAYDNKLLCGGRRCVGAEE